MSAALVLGLLSGCGSSSAASTAAASPTPSASPAPSAAEAAGPRRQQQDGNTVRGTVTAVDGDTITIQTMGNGGMGGGPGGQMPGGGAPGAPQDGSAPSSEIPEMSAAPSASPDAQTSATPGGSAGPGGQGQMPDAQLGQAGEEITVTLSSGTKISISANGTTSDGTSSDLTVGCVVSVTYGDDGETVTEITVMDMSGEGPQAPPNGQTPSGGQASDAPQTAQNG